MKISIITPSFNQAHFLEKTILSIWKQTGNFKLEHIVIDGGSTDESIKVLKQYEKIFKENQFEFTCRNFHFHWISEPDNGQSHAINKGFSQSTGEILGWLNSDDTFTDDTCLEAICQAFLISDADLVVGNFYCIDEFDTQLEFSSFINTLDNTAFQKKLKLLPKYDLITQPACLFKRVVWEKYGIDESYHYAMDWKFWVSAHFDNCFFYKIDKFIANNRLHQDTKTSSDNPERFQEILRIYHHFDTWCLNRISFTLYFWLLNHKDSKVLNIFSVPVVFMGKKIRNGIIKYFKIY